METVQILSDEPYFPWELLKLQGEAGEEGPFLCEAFSVTRWLRNRQTVGELPLQRIALVLPTGSDLPSSKGEKEDLVELVGSERVAEIPPTFSGVKDALAGGDYDGWHFAGHGSARVQDPDRAQLGLDGEDFLTPTNLVTARANLSRFRPLIFLNGCDTGRAGFSLTGLGGWAQQSLAAGAGAYIGTLWTVRDQKARAFAQAFYQAFLGGEPFGEAVRQARLRVRDQFPGDPAWLAYTVYCHPNARVGLGKDAALIVERPANGQDAPVFHEQANSFGLPAYRETPASGVWPWFSLRARKIWMLGGAVALSVLAILASKSFHSFQVPWESQKPKPAETGNVPTLPPPKIPKEPAATESQKPKREPPSAPAVPKRRTKDEERTNAIWSRPRVDQSSEQRAVLKDHQAKTFFDDLTLAADFTSFSPGIYHPELRYWWKGKTPESRRIEYEDPSFVVSTDRGSYHIEVLPYTEDAREIEVLVSFKSANAGLANKPEE